MNENKKDWYEKNKEDQREKCRIRYHTGDKKRHAEMTWANKIKRDYGITVEQYKQVVGRSRWVMQNLQQQGW